MSDRKVHEYPCCLCGLSKPQRGGRFKPTPDGRRPFICLDCVAAEVRAVAMHHESMSDRDLLERMRAALAGENGKSIFPFSMRSDSS